MARTTGIVLTMGAITFANQLVLPTVVEGGEGNDIDDELAMGMRIVVATGVTALALAGAERLWEEGAVAVAWLALATVLLTRIEGQPSPIDRGLAVWTDTNPYRRR